MSWQAYVDSSLVGSGHVDFGAIISLAGDSTWAATQGFQLKAGEGKALHDILSNAAGAVDKAYGEGFHVQGLRYVVTKIEGRSLYGRGTGDKTQHGIVIVQTKQAILIGHYNEKMQVGNATQTVEALADYLIKLNY